MKLKDFQDRFQRAILDRDDAILKDIPDGPRETKANLLGIYRDGYVLRLIEVVGNDHEQLRSYLGEERFSDMCRIYIAECPSHHPNARWFAHRLPEFLRSHAGYSREPVLGDLAALERALNDAFDGVDAPALALGDLLALPPEDWAGLGFAAHPTALCIDVLTNAAAIWAALKAGEKPLPRVVARDVRILVWRRETTAMLRELTPEEAMMWTELGNGARFGELCQLLAAFDDPATASARAAGHLKAWLEAGLLSRVVA